MEVIPVGQEPERIKKRLDTLFPKLDEAYPDKVIRGLQKDHKKWAETVTELYRALGYESNTAFLEAYGYTVEHGAGGRPGNDHMAVIEELKKRYPNGSDFRKLSQLQEANPDLAPKFKTLTNNANKLFGMPLAKYLTDVGVLKKPVQAPPRPEKPESIAEPVKSKPMMKPDTKEKTEEKTRTSMWDTPRYNPSPEQLKDYYTTGAHPIADALDEIRGTLEKTLKANGNYLSDPKRVRAAAGKGYIEWQKNIYYLSEDGFRATIATKLYSPNKRGGYDGYRTGPAKMLRDTVGRYGFLGIVVADANGKIVGPLVDTYSDLITPLWDLGKLRIENVSLERLGWNDTNAVFDLVMTESPLNTALLLPEKANMSLQPEELPERKPFDYSVLKGWKNRSWKGAGVDSFSNGVARGTAEELNALAEEADRLGAPLEPTQIPGIFEISLKNFFNYNDGNLYLKDVIEKHPSLKVVGFIEDWSPALEVWVLYSESGYPFVTEGKRVGHFDDHSDLPWQWEYSPTEDFSDQFIFIQSGVPMTVRYKFPFRNKWMDGQYYIRKNGKTFRMTTNTAPQKLPFDSPYLWKLKRSTYWEGHAFIQEYLGNETNVVFPEKVGDQVILGISSRKEKAPTNYKKIERIQLSDSYYWIGAHAFQGCASLKELVFPRDLYQIGDEAFADCTALKKVAFNDICDQKYERHPVPYAEVHEKKAIGKNLFKNCTALETVVLQSSRTEVSEKETFPNCGAYKITGVIGEDDSYTVRHNVGHIQKAEDGVAEQEEIFICSSLPYVKLPMVGEILTYHNGTLWRANSMLGRYEVLPDKMQVIAVKPWGLSEWGITVSTAIDETLVVQAPVKNELDDPTQQSLKGKIFVLDNNTVAGQLTKLIEERGGVVKSSVVLNTDYLIINPHLDGSTVKRTRAQELLERGKTNLKIISYVEFFNMIRKK